MYSLTLSKKDSHRLKKIIRQMMIKNDFTVADLSRLTGYSKSTIYHYLSEGKYDSKRKYRFVAAALCEVLEIGVGGNL